MLGFLYTGQGAQQVGMGQDFYNRLETAKAFYDNHADIRQVSFNGPMETLTQTKYAQLALQAFAICATDALKNMGVVPQVALGLSLGEYGALYAAGVYQQDQVMRLLSVRSMAMNQACLEKKGTMLAVLGLNKKLVEEGCAFLSEQHQAMVALANDNMPNQQVVGVQENICQEVRDYFLQKGAKRCVPLQVQGAFHTPFMASAQTPLSQALASEEKHQMNIPVIGNVKADVLPLKEVSQELVHQVVSPVRMVESIQKMAQLGVTQYIEIGPGNTMAGFIRRILGKEVWVQSISQYDDVVQVAKQIRGDINGSK